MRLIAVPMLIGWFCHDLVLSSISVARTVLSPRGIARPRLITVPLTATSDMAITLVANYITLTPGTLTVDVSADRRTLLIHDLLSGESSEGTRAAITGEIEPRVLRVTGT